MLSTIAAGIRLALLFVVLRGLFLAFQEGKKLRKRSHIVLSNPIMQYHSYWKYTGIGELHYNGQNVGSQSCPL